jgi:hypothetical protein
MKHVAMAVLLGSLSIKGWSQQVDSTIKKRVDTIKVGGMTIIKSMEDNRKEIFISDTSIRKSDTIKFGSITIIGKDISKNLENLTQKVESIDLSKLGGKIEDIDLSKLGELKDKLLKKKPKKVSTNWFVFDIGFAGYDDKTDYSSFDARAFMASPLNQPPTSNDFALRTSRVSNFNLWFFMQRMSIIKNVVNLKYGFGIESNNYFFKTGITYVDKDEPTIAILSDVYTIRKDPGTVTKNKLVANYFTVPLMINFNTNPQSSKRGFQISFGMSGGYLYASRQKQKDGSGTEKTKSEFNLEPFKLSYIGELGLGKVRLYGSMATGKMHQYGVNHVPYTVGVRFSN